VGGTVACDALNRLGDREAATIIARLVGNKELPADVQAEIVERTDGIPLFFLGDTSIRVAPSNLAGPLTDQI
jgi:hypothetical protein